MRRLLYLFAGIILVVGTLKLVQQRKEAKVHQQVDAIEAAVTNAKSYHSKLIGYQQLYGDFVQEAWVFCPGDRYQTMTTGKGVSEEKIWFEGHIYSRSKGSIGDWSPWYFNNREASDTAPGCSANSADNPFDLKVGFSDMKRATITIDPNVRHINGETCNEYNFKAHHGPDFAYSFDQTLCVNPDDHLPREVRQDSVIAGEVKKLTIDQWNTATKPTLPEGFDSTQALR